MGLRIKQIRLTNWKCYQKQTIDFNLDIDNHIWVIFGLNGFGKTSILEAILWCLYGSEAIAKQDLVKFFNEIAVKNNPNLEIAIQLVLEKDEKTYLITRTAKRMTKGTTVYAEVNTVTLIENGKQQTDARERIDFLLPKSCREFFFFDGKKIESYAQVTQTGETKEAIEKILGIPELENLRHDLGIVAKNLHKQLGEANASNHRLKQLRKQSFDIQEEIELIIVQIQKAETEYEDAKRIAKDAEENARQNEDLQKIYQQIDTLNQQKKSHKDKLDKTDEKIEISLRQAAIPLLKEFIREMTDDLQRRYQLTNRKIVTICQLKELLFSDTCVCGRCIDEQIKQFLLQQIEQQEATESLTQKALNQDELKDSLLTLSRYPNPDIGKLLIDKDELIDNIDEINKTIEGFKKNTSGRTQQKNKSLWSQAMRELENVKDCEKRVENLQRDLDNKQKQKDSLVREITQFASQSQETANLGKQLDFADKLHQAVEELIQWRIAERKTTIETHTSKIHRHITNKPDEYIGVEINTDYSLGVRHISGDILSPDKFSPGEKEALAFAFIAGLNLASEVTAPLVMDTPFGHLDSVHKKNIINYLPHLPSQVIVLATDEDLPEDTLQKLKPDIAQIHQIKRLDASEYASYVEVAE